MGWLEAVAPVQALPQEAGLLIIRPQGAGQDSGGCVRVGAPGENEALGYWRHHLQHRQHFMSSEVSAGGAAC